MIDYKKRIEEAAMKGFLNQLKGSSGRFPGIDDTSTLSIKPEFVEAIEALLHQVEAETDRNSRIDELEHLNELSYHSTPAGGLTISQEDIELRIAELHREES